MTFWIYNPPEPTGQPTAPGPDLNAGYVASGANGVTRGRCGGCHACPDVWRMQVPIIGEPYFDAHYAGTVYLKRMPYNYITAPDVEFGDFFDDKCSWAQSLSPPLPDANLYLGPYADQGQLCAGWHLSYVQPGLGSGWMLYSPAETATVEFEPNAQTRWVCRDIFRCLGLNRFQKYDNNLQYAFPFAPDFLEIEPFYA